MNNFRQRVDLIQAAIEAIGPGARPYVKRGVFLVWDEVVGHAQTALGIIMPPQSTEDLAYRYATVIAVAPDVESVRVNDRVIVGKFMGTEINYEYGRICKIKIVSEDQLDAVLV